MSTNVLVRVFFLMNCNQSNRRQSSSTKIFLRPFVEANIPSTTFVEANISSAKVVEANISSTGVKPLGTNYSCAVLLSSRIDMQSNRRRLPWQPPVVKNIKMGNKLVLTSCGWVGKKKQESKPYWCSRPEKLLASRRKKIVSPWQTPNVLARSSLCSLEISLFSTSQ